jgi:8-oxo-dGTP pyrophosphatase MutT (NUDIX family)
MAFSEHYRALRRSVGSSLLLMPAVAAIIRDADGKILVQQQHDDSWSLPAGAIEPGESPAQAVVREVFEETGFAVRPESIVAVVGGAGCRVRYANGDEVEYVVTVFECRITGGQRIDSNEETKRLVYFSAAEMPPLGFQYPPEVFALPRAALFAQADD